MGIFERGSGQERPLAELRTGISRAIARREHLIGSKFDILCKKAEAMADKMAKSKGGKRTSTSDGWQEGWNSVGSAV